MFKSKIFDPIKVVYMCMCVCVWVCVCASVCVCKSISRKFFRKLFRGLLFLDGGEAVRYNYLY